MKKILLLIFLGPITLKAQKLVPRFENDTLYTTSGFTIYKGQTLTFAVGTGKNGNFRFVKVKGNDNPNTLANKSVIVEDVSDFKISGLGNVYIRIHSSITKNNGDMKRINFNLAFDKAIEGFQGLAPELVVTEEFKNKSKKNTADEISKLYKLYQEGAITKEEFEAQKKKILDQ